MTQMTRGEQLDVLRDIANAVDGQLRLDYSGRCMCGEKCAAISCDSPTAVLEEAGACGIKGGRTDRLGRGYIVYWPSIKTQQSGKGV